MIYILPVRCSGSDGVDSHLFDDAGVECVLDAQLRNEIGSDIPGSAD